MRKGLCQASSLWKPKQRQSERLPPPPNIPAIASLWQLRWHRLWARLTFDHVYIVGPVSDRQRDGLLVPLHQVHHHRLLLGGDPAADDRAALTGQVDEVLLPLLFPSFQTPLTLRPQAALFFCPWELQLQNLTSLGLLLQKNLILGGIRGLQPFAFLFQECHSQDLNHVMVLGLHHGWYCFDYKTYLL